MTQESHHQTVPCVKPWKILESWKMLRVYLAEGKTNQLSFIQLDYLRPYNFAK